MKKSQREEGGGRVTTSTRVSWKRAQGRGRAIMVTEAYVGARGVIFPMACDAATVAVATADAVVVPPISVLCVQQYYSATEHTQWSSTLRHQITHACSITVCPSASDSITKSRLWIDGTLLACSAS
jgi:hypothetical protein